ncbi:MAG: hypothetical protein OXG77_02375 [Chloroflexi bacterium]|nr:hypothetical protein [Chloroflexota bacterium]
MPSGEDGNHSIESGLDLKIVCWNMAHRSAAWSALLDMPGVDVGLLQEASRVPEELSNLVEVDRRLWEADCGYPSGYPSVVARLSDRVTTRFVKTRSISRAGSHDFYTSEWGTLGAAVVEPVDGGDPITVISMAPAYNHHTHESGSPSSYETINSVHRLISDLARLVGRRSRVIAAGDWTINRGWSRQSTPIWNKREALHFKTAFDRMTALGFRHLAPEGRENERGEAVTFVPIGSAPEKAFAQLDFVFATENIADRVSVLALNQPEEWGPSDHCRIEINFE